MNSKHKVKSDLPFASLLRNVSRVEAVFKRMVILCGSIFPLALITVDSDAAQMLCKIHSTFLTTTDDQSVLLPEEESNEAQSHKPPEIWVPPAAPEKNTPSD